LNTDLKKELLEFKITLWKSIVPFQFGSSWSECMEVKHKDLDNQKELFLSLSVENRSNEIDEEYLQMEKEDFEFAFAKVKSENKDLVFFLY
jgi:hypothetical protein